MVRSIYELTGMKYTWPLLHSWNRALLFPSGRSILTSSKVLLVSSCMVVFLYQINL